METIRAHLMLQAAVILILVLAVPGLSPAQRQFELIPSISVSEEYDDNIYLVPEDETSDYLTLVTPGLTLRHITATGELSVSYSPTFVWYEDETENDTVRHSAGMDYRRELTEHLTFDLTDTFYRSEEPIEEAVDVEGVRRTRETYWRNSGEAAFALGFGPENELRVGYGQSYLDNEDETVDDGRIQTPFADMTYWFTTKNGIELTYEYVLADFWREEGTADDDYDGHTAGARYLYRWSPHTTTYLGYEGSTRDFDGDTEDYDVHEGYVGVDHSFSPELTVALEGGYFVQDNDVSDDETGYAYSASLVRTFSRGSFTIEGSGGWDEAYLEAERRGFTRFYSVSSRLEYRILEPVGVYLGGGYRIDEDEAERDWETVRGDAGLTWDFYRWASLSFSYTYAERDDDIDTEDYEVNRVMATLTLSKPYRW